MQQMEAQWQSAFNTSNAGTDALESAGSPVSVESSGPPVLWEPPEHEPEPATSKPKPTKKPLKSKQSQLSAGPASAPASRPQGGVLVGAPLQGRVLVIDDVITAGTAVREVIAMISGAGAELAGVVIGLDRKERGTGKLSAVDEVRRAHGAPVISIITMDHIIDYLAEDGGASAPTLAAMREYREHYGV